VLRDELGLTGAKKGCGRGECGTCTVLLGPRAVLSCMVLIGDTTGPVTTIEGLEADDLRGAFADFGGFQCGFCTPGQIMRGEALLRTGGEITERTTRQALAGNLCRCTGYSPIVDALLAVASHRRRA
jgi:aerobic-type carbon monoxide dehydrogenase small subunit (CoxS/CutS family)